RVLKHVGHALDRRSQRRRLFAQFLQRRLFPVQRIEHASQSGNLPGSKLSVVRHGNQLQSPPQRRLVPIGRRHGQQSREQLLRRLVGVGHGGNQHALQVVLIQRAERRRAEEPVQLRAQQDAGQGLCRSVLV